MTALEYENAVAGAREIALAELLRQRLVRSIIATPLGVGSEQTLSVPAGSLWELLAVDAIYTASATVGTRTPSLSVRDADGNELARLPPGTQPVATQVIRLSWQAGYGEHYVLSAGLASIASPPLVMQAGWKVLSATSGFDAGDAWTYFAALVREWSPEAIATQSAWIGARLR